VFRGGAVVLVPQGTTMTLRARGQSFTDVDLPEGRGRIANSYLTRCR
jgi:hypothetical protein